MCEFVPGIYKAKQSNSINAIGFFLSIFFIEKVIKKVITVEFSLEIEMDSILMKFLKDFDTSAGAQWRYDN